MPRPHTAALTGIFAVLLLASVSCAVDSSPRATTTVTPSAAASASPTVGPTSTAASLPVLTFTKSSGEGVSLTVEIADAAWSRARGLMFRESLPDDSGMLFVWPEDTSSGFWMKDTLIPLSIAFIDSAGVILDIQDMQPLDETLHTAPAAFRYGVEANQGWFAERGITAGDTVTLPDGLRTPES